MTHASLEEDVNMSFGRFVYSCAFLLRASTFFNCYILFLCHFFHLSRSGKLIIIINVVRILFSCSMLLQGLTLSENEVYLEVMQHLVAPEFCKDYTTFVPLANILRCRHVAELQVFFLMS